MSTSRVLRLMARRTSHVEHSLEPLRRFGTFALDQPFALGLAEPHLPPFSAANEAMAFSGAPKRVHEQLRSSLKRGTRQRDTRPLDPRRDWFRSMRIREALQRLERVVRRMVEEVLPVATSWRQLELLSAHPRRG